MFELHDLRESRVWQEAHGEGLKKGKTLAQQELVRKKLAKGKTLKQIAEDLDIPAAKVRRLAKSVDK